jgi:thymidylate synthase
MGRNVSDVKYDSVNIEAESVDELVKKGLSYVERHGISVSCRAGDACQAYGVNYVLLDPRNRVHTLRETSIRYFARELLAYFSGSLEVDKMSEASRFWEKLKDENGCINSNYGYYVFYQLVESDCCRTQYEWVIKRLLANRDTRRAIININQNFHKSDTRDFPCTVSLLFYIRDDLLFLEAFSRSTDVVIGLPYDIGFFSLLHELIYMDLKGNGFHDLRLGSTVMRTCFTQIYSRDTIRAIDAKSSQNGKTAMPIIENARQFLDDIYSRKATTEMMRWIVEKAS